MCHGVEIEAFPRGILISAMTAVGARIQHISAKIKPLLGALAGEWGLFGLILLTALGSFGLGRLSALIEARPLVSIQEAAAADLPAMAPGGLLVASRTGSVYYYPWCSGAAKITAANQRWFQSESAAKAAGYSPAKNCKGLTTDGQ